MKYCRLRFKVVVGVAGPLLLIMGLFAYFQYWHHRELMLKLLETTSIHISQIIGASLQYTSPSQIQQLIDHLAEAEGIRGIFLQNMQGEIVMTPQGVTAGGLRNGVCQPPELGANMVGPFAHETSGVVLTLEGGERIFRICNPISPLSSAPVEDGVLVIDLDMHAIDQHLARDLQYYLSLSTIAIGLVVVVNTLLMNRLVVNRVLQVVSTIRRFGENQLDQRVATENGDELGELGASFNVMADELKRLYDEMKQKDLWRHRLLRQIITAQEEERKRIARELHDDLAQTLAALTVTLKMTRDVLPPELARTKEQLDTAHDLTEQILEQIREWILDLRPAMLDDLGLMPAIRRFAEARLDPEGVRVVFQVQGPKRRLLPETETVLFRIVQEAINNVAKHASASQVSIQLQFKENVVTGLVEDDGQGFDAEAILCHPDANQGLGLLGMQERAILVGGTVVFASASHLEGSRGTRVYVQLPLEKDV